MQNGDRAFERQGYQDALKYYEKALPRLDKAGQELVKIKILQAQRSMLIDDGDAEFRRGAFDAALKAYQKALELSPGGDIEQRIDRAKAQLAR